MMRTLLSRVGDTVKSIRNQFQSDNRGQILLVTAVTIILIIFTMGMAINTAGFTERDRADGAEYYQAEADGKLGDTVSALEDGLRQTNHDPSITDKTGHYEDNEIPGIESRLAKHFGTDSGNVNISHRSTNSGGVRIWMSPYNNFSVTGQSAGGGPPGGGPPGGGPPGGGAPGLENRPSPVVYENADATRDFAITLTGNELTTGYSTGNTFRITTDTAGGGSTTYAMYISDSSSNEVTIENRDSGETCSVGDVTESSPMHISFTGGTVNGDHCSHLPGTEEIESVEIANGDRAEGSFNAVIDTADSNVFPDNNEKSVSATPGDENDEMQPHNAVYSVTVDVTVTTPTATIDTTVRVTPGLYGDVETIYG